MLNSNTEPRLWKVSQVARIMGVSRATVQRMIDAGKLRAKELPALPGESYSRLRVRDIDLDACMADLAIARQRRSGQSTESNWRE